MRLGLSLGWSRRVGFIKGAAILLLLHITLTLLGTAKADELDGGGGGNGIVRRAMNFAHALRVRRANFAHALRIKRGGRLSGYTHALRIKKTPSSFALRIKKGDQLGGSGGEDGEDDYYDNYSNVPDSEYYTGADSDDGITGDTAQYNNLQKRDMNIGRRAAFAHALRIKKRSAGSPDWGGSTRGLYWLTTTGVPLQPQQSLIDKYQYYAMGGPGSLEPTEPTPPLQSKYRIYRDRKSSRFNSHVLRVK